MMSTHPAKAVLASAEARVADLGSDSCVALEATAIEDKAAVTKAAALGAQIGELKAALRSGS
jgi:hypothetical protein